MSTPIYKNEDGTEGKRFVKPGGADRKPRHPELGRRIAKDGEWIIDSPRLRKFLRDEDIVEVKAVPEKTVPEKTASEKKGAKS